jgi:hypothetical protein
MQFDPQPFHLDAEAAKDTLFGGWWRAVGTRRRSACGFWWRAACPLLAGLSGSAEKSPGPTRLDRGTFSRLRAKFSNSGRRDPMPTGVWQRSVARRETNVARSCRCSLPSSLCRVRQNAPAQGLRPLSSAKHSTVSGVKESVFVGGVLVALGKRGRHALPV